MTHAWLLPGAKPAEHLTRFAQGARVFVFFALGACSGAALQAVVGLAATCLPLIVVGCVILLC